MEKTNSNDDLIEVKQNSTLGRYLVAAREISAGEIILNESPLIKGPCQVTGPVCLSCLRRLDSDNASECVKCGWPLCDDESCHADGTHEAECSWTTHKRKEKVKIKQFVTPHRTYECITTIRCLYQRETNPSIWKKLTKLESHCDKRKDTEKYESDRLIVARFLYRFFKISPEEFTEDEILRVCGIIQINGHEIPLTNPPHVAIYDLASMLEHSCVPNACKTFSNEGRLIIRATRPISKGDHISICYTDPLWSTANRLEHLFLTKYFHCGCPRCSDPTEMGTYYSAVKCSKICEGYFIPQIKVGERIDNRLPEPTWTCTTCNKIRSNTEMNKILKRIAQDYSMTDKKDPNSCELFLNHYQKSQLLHPNHYFLNDVRLKLAQLYGQMIGNDIQSLSDADLKRKIELCREVLELTTILYPAEWRIQGILKFELQASIAEDARRKMINGQIDPDNLKLMLLESKKWLKETIFCLKYEPDILPEGKIAKQAENNLNDLESLLTRMYFQI